LIVSIVVVAANKTTKNVGGDNNTQIALDESKDTSKNESSSSNSKSEVVATTDLNKSSQSNSNLSNKTTTTTTKTTTAKSDLPDTGPEEILPIALMAGALVAYVGSSVLAKRDA
jgi:uncharacterized membrane protein